MFRMQFKRYVTRRLMAKIAELYKANVKAKSMEGTDKSSIETQTAC